MVQHSETFKTGSLVVLGASVPSEGTVGLQPPSSGDVISSALVFSCHEHSSGSQQPLSDSRQRKPPSRGSHRRLFCKLLVSNTVISDQNTLFSV